MEVSFFPKHTIYVHKNLSQAIQSCYMDVSRWNDSNESKDCLNGVILIKNNTHTNTCLFQSDPIPALWSKVMHRVPVVIQRTYISSC